MPLVADTVVAVPVMSPLAVLTTLAACTVVLPAAPKVPLLVNVPLAATCMLPSARKRLAASFR